MGKCPEAQDCLDAPEQIAQICYKSDQTCGMCASWKPIEVNDYEEILMGKCEKQQKDALLPCDHQPCKFFEERGSEKKLKKAV